MKSLGVAFVAGALAHMVSEKLLGEPVEVRRMVTAGIGTAVVVFALRTFA